MPDPHGFAGMYAGVSHGALVLAGGANFPDRPPWEGGRKVWHDRVFVLESPGGEWRVAEQRLPSPRGYGVSVTTPRGVLCVGGSDTEKHFADVFLLEWSGRRILRSDLPPLPFPLADACGATVGDVVYVAGGSTSPAASEATGHFLCLDLSHPSAVWRPLESWPGPGRILATAAVREGSLFLVGGARLVPGAGGRTTREFLRDAYRYTPGAGWKRVAGLTRPIAAACSPAPAIGPSHFLLVGGDDGTHFFGPPQNHGGFSADVWAYHTITDTWSRLGAMPNPRAVTSAVPWAKGFVVPSGEVRAGVRSPGVQSLKVESRVAGFGWLNYAMLGLYPVVMLSISYAVGRKRTSDEFFRGAQRIPWWAAGLSIYATMLSSITYMAIPAKAYATDWAYILTVPAIVAVAPLVAYVYLPFYRQLDVTSAYEYLERRFNVAARWFASASFVVLQLGRTAIVLYLPSLALATVTRFDVVTCILLMGATSILMTFLGGVESVVWTDVAQTVILLAGAGLSLALILARADLGVGDMVREAAAQQKFFGGVEWSWDWFAATGSVILVGSLLSNLIPYTASQDVVQRYLTTRDERQAARAILTNALVSVPSSVLFFAVGTALFVFYRNHPGRLDPTVATDAIFPLYMVNELPPGVAGLVVAGIFAAAQPTSNLNSMATALVTDFYRRAKPAAPDADVLRLAQWLTVTFGVLGTGVALLLAKLEMASLWDLFMQVIGLTGGALAGLFALGIFTRRAHGTGAMVGAVAGVAALYFVQQHTRLNFFLYGGTGIMSCVAAGYLASLLLPGRRKPLEGLTIFTARRGDVAGAPAALPPTVAANAGK